MQNVPQKEEYKEWLENPITKRVFEFFKEEAMARRSLLASGSCKRESVFETGEEYTKQWLAAQIYENISNIEYEDIFLEEKE